MIAPKSPTRRLTRSRPIRSCESCRTRRVKCDRRAPRCSNCITANNVCIVPRPAPEPSYLPKVTGAGTFEGEGHPPPEHIAKRLKRLEKVVDVLTTQGDPILDSVSGSQGRGTSDVWNVGQEGQRLHDLEKKLEGLIYKKPKPMYLSPNSWVALEDDESELMTNRASTNSQRLDNLQSNRQSPMVSLLFTHDLDADVSTLRFENDTLVVKLVDIFIANVDPFIRVIHKPTFFDNLHEYLTARRKKWNPQYPWNAALSPQSAHKQSDSQRQDFRNDLDSPESKLAAFEGLLLAVCHAAVASTDNETLHQLFQDHHLDHYVFLAKYRKATQVTLSHVDFLQSERLESLQALVLLLSISPPDYDMRSPWIQVGMAIRIAQTKGLHRDGSHCGLEPLETELRRRIWAQLRLLDMRMAEELGCEPTITESSYDTKLPLDIEDADISDRQEEEERVGASFHIQAIETPPRKSAGQLLRPPVTEMTISLIRYECVALVTSLLKSRLHHDTLDKLKDQLPSDGEISRLEKDQTKEQMMLAIDQLEQRLFHKYRIESLDMKNPLQQAIANIARVIVAKARFLVNLQFRKSHYEKVDAQEGRNCLFAEAVNLLELTVELRIGPGKSIPIWSPSWNWNASPGSQFHASAYVLYNLGRGWIAPELATRAWKAIDQLFPREDEAEPFSRTKSSANKAGHIQSGQTFGRSPLQRLSHAVRSRTKDHAAISESSLVTLDRLQDGPNINSGACDWTIGQNEIGHEASTEDFYFDANLMADLDLFNFDFASFLA